MRTLDTFTGVVVDDEPQVRAIFAGILRKAGMQVFEADSGVAAIALARKARPDFVMTDLNMPGMDGLEMCRRLRRDPALKDVVILVVSGADQDQRDEAIVAGCDVVLSKPCSPALLLETIRQLLIRPS